MQLMTNKETLFGKSWCESETARWVIDRLVDAIANVFHVYVPTYILVLDHFVVHLPC